MCRKVSGAAKDAREQCPGAWESSRRSVKIWSSVVLFGERGLLLSAGAANHESSVTSSSTSLVARKSGPVSLSVG